MLNRNVDHENLVSNEFRALALPHSLWQNANARSVSVAIFYGGKLTRIKSFDAKFSCFSSLTKRLHCFFRNLAILWLNYAVHVPVVGLNPRWHLWLRLPSNFSDFSVALVVLLHRTDSSSQWKDKRDLVVITQWIFMVCGEMEFLFECSTWYHTRVEHIKRNSISPSNHVLSIYPTKITAVKVRQIFRFLKQIYQTASSLYFPRVVKDRAKTIATITGGHRCNITLTSLSIHNERPRLKAFSLPSSRTSTCW